MLRFFLRLTLILVAALGIWLCWGLLLPIKPSRGEVVLLRPGWSTRHIALELKNAGVIHSANAFLLYHYVVKPRSLKAGEYKFDAFESAVQVHSRLVRGDVLTHTVVIPEGFNMFDIAAAIEAAGLGPKDDFLKVAREETELVHDIDPQATSLEGFLFPDTYEFTRTQSMSDMAAAMVRRFRQEARTIGLIAPNGGAAGAVLATNGAVSGATPTPSGLHRIVTLASIVEKETAAPEERPLVASVYQNRLSKRIALNADPSIIYAALLAGRYQGTIYQSDLQSNSPYNTYRYAGLPPGPIANPGRDSLKAAMSPASSDYYYFVSDNNGHHRFARTLSEHSHNVVLYRRALTAANRQGASQNR